MDPQEDKHLRKTKSGGLIEKRPHVPKMLWMKNRLQKNKPSSTSSSDLMDRVQNFLKEISESNRELEKAAAKNPEAFNIENTDGCKDNVIEMNLAVVPVHEDSDEEESSDEDEDDNPRSVIATGKLLTEHKKQNGRLVQDLSVHNQEILEDEESNDVILVEDDDHSESSDSDYSAMLNNRLKAQQRRGPLVEVICGVRDDEKLDDVISAVQDDKHESDDSNDCDSTLDKLSSIQNKERSGPLIEVLSQENTT